MYFKEEKSRIQQEITALLKTFGSRHETVAEWQESHQEIHMLTEQPRAPDTSGVTIALVENSIR